MIATTALVTALALAAPQEELERYGGVNLVNETPDQHDARMQWFRDAKFGMFIHWGAYSTAGGEWKGKPVGGVGEWLLSNAQIKPEDYEVLQKQFNPVKFDAKRWVARHIASLPKSGIRDFFELVAKMKGQDVISLGVGEPDFVTPWHVREAAIFALERGKTYYTSNLGLLELRLAALAGRFRDVVHHDRRLADLGA